MDGLNRDRALGLVPGDPDNTVSYEVYPGESGSGLETVRQLCLEAVQRLTQGYIWQRDTFSLQLSTSACQPWLKKARVGRASGGVSSSNTNTTPCLWGQTCYGDNIEDEWLITWLLLQLSRHFTLSARVWDSDGEFLLIEAAYALPKWLKPEVAAERVWLHGGALHLIPLPSQQNPTLPLKPTTSQALQLLSSPVDTLAPSRMQAAIAARLSEYPQQISKNTYNAAAILPAKVAAILQREPQLIAPAVEAFHYRDPLDVKAARLMQHFPSQDMVDAVVSFSRCLYAQTVAQSYEAPHNYPMPLPSEDSFPAAQLGLKIAAGFEMLIARVPTAGESSASGSSAEGLRDVQGSPAWESFVQGLADTGYFEDELSGSQRHRQLMAKAAERFRATEAYARNKAAVHQPAERVLALLQEPCSFDASKCPEKSGSDSWMMEGAEDIERQLQKRQAEVAGGSLGETEADLAARFKDFLGGEAGLEGADVLQDMFGGSGKSPEEGPVLLDEQEIWREMKRVLQLQEQYGLEPNSSGDEGSSFYGDATDNDDDDDDGGNSNSMSTKHKTQDPSKSNVGGARPIAETPRERRQTFGDRFSSGGPSMSTQHPGSYANSPGNQRFRGDNDQGTSMSTRKQSESDEDEGWDAATATDSDDDAAYFDEAYDEAIKSQLQGTNAALPPMQKVTTEDPSSSTHASGSLGEGQHGDAELTPVDVDMNLVQNLLASYDAQQGLPGPVSNLAGMLGLQLPSSGRSSGSKDDFM